MNVVDDGYDVGIWWCDCWAGFTEWRFIQRQYSHHAATAWQPHGNDDCHLSTLCLKKHTTLWWR